MTAHNSSPLHLPQVCSIVFSQWVKDVFTWLCMNGTCRSWLFAKLYHVLTTRAPSSSPVPSSGSSAGCLDSPPSALQVRLNIATHHWGKFLSYQWLCMVLLYVKVSACKRWSTCEYLLSNMYCCFQLTQLVAAKKRRKAEFECPMALALLAWSLAL